MQASEIIFTGFVLPAAGLAVFAYVYAVILTDHNMLLHNVAVWAQNKLPWWLHKPLISCEVCVAGQLALWLYGIATTFQKPLFYVCGHGYNPLLHLLFIAVTILLTRIISKCIN